MPLIEGTSRTKTLEAVYDFAVDGGATSTITLRSDGTFGNTVPAGAVVTGGFIDVSSSCLSGSGTMALNLEGAGDILAAVGQAGLTAGRKSVVPAFTGATTVKTTAARSLTVTIATAAFTAGSFRVVLYYK